MLFVNNDKKNFYQKIIINIYFIEKKKYTLRWSTLYTRTFAEGYIKKPYWKYFFVVAVVVLFNNICFVRIYCLNVFGILNDNIKLETYQRQRFTKFLVKVKNTQA